MGAFIAKLLLPTVSSLALLLDVSVATKRGFHMEAMVYFFTMFFTVEWDYAYVHSFYHLSMAVSIILLLPKRNRHCGAGGNAAKLNCYTLCCCV
ncbi:hypothetical protein COCON_G00151660 [Conger conger]|uniref:Uncharacterized protein n=1 Tax=Conger conger TaxID=82655 RepID=A0A9Q1D905_CONCO|nr:hypothetical protein COCON_G00151660 [Conger conger]